MVGIERGRVSDDGDSWNQRPDCRDRDSEPGIATVASDRRSETRRRGRSGRKGRRRRRDQRGRNGPRRRDRCRSCCRNRRCSQHRGRKGQEAMSSFAATDHVRRAREQDKVCVDERERGARQRVGEQAKAVD